MAFTLPPLPYGYDALEPTIDAQTMTLHHSKHHQAYVDKLKRTMGAEVDFARRPVEDFARGTLVFTDPDGNRVMIEATTSWAYVGPGLRIQLELLGPEYSMEFSSLNTGLKIFLSREVQGSQGEDLVEKQNAEQGLMPVLEDEAHHLVLVAELLEDRCVRRAARPSALRGRQPELVEQDRLELSG